jgi:hypothetical protein
MENLPCASGGQLAVLSTKVISISLKIGFSVVSISTALFFSKTSGIYPFHKSPAFRRFGTEDHQSPIFFSPSEQVSVLAETGREEITLFNTRVDNPGAELTHVHFFDPQFSLIMFKFADQRAAKAKTKGWVIFVERISYKFAGLPIRTNCSCITFVFVTTFPLPSNVFESVFFAEVLINQAGFEFLFSCL